MSSMQLYHSVRLGHTRAETFTNHGMICSAEDGFLPFTKALRNEDAQMANTGLLVSIKNDQSRIQGSRGESRQRSHTATT